MGFQFHTSFKPQSPVNISRLNYSLILALRSAQVQDIHLNFLRVHEFFICFVSLQNIGGFLEIL